MRRYLLSFGIVFSLLACHTSVSSTDSLSADSRAAGSKEDVAKHTVALVDLDDKVPHSFCSGVIVARDMVLTAAHCLENRPKKFGLFFGFTIPDSSVDSGIQIVRSFLVHPHYASATLSTYKVALNHSKEAKGPLPFPPKPLNNIALIRIPRELPDTHTYTSLAAGDPVTGEALISAGFGCGDASCRNMKDSLQKTSMVAASALPDTSHLVLRGLSESGSCRGSSGSPTFMQDGSELKVLAITSIGRSDCHFGISADTWVPPYATWIKDSIETLRQAD